MIQNIGMHFICMKQNILKEIRKIGRGCMMKNENLALNSTPSCHFLNKLARDARQAGPDLDKEIEMQPKGKFSRWEVYNHIPIVL